MPLHTSLELRLISVLDFSACSFLRVFRFAHKPIPLGGVACRCMLQCGTRIPSMVYFSDPGIYSGYTIRIKL